MLLRVIACLYSTNICFLYSIQLFTMTSAIKTVDYDNSLILVLCNDGTSPITIIQLSIMTITIMAYIHKICQNVIVRIENSTI